EITVQKASLFITTEYIAKEDIIKKVKDARQQYNKAVIQYNNFVKNNKIMELTKQITQLKQMYEFYTSNIIAIEKNIWQAKSLKEQIQSGGISSVGEIGDALAVLKFKSSIFAGSTELPLKFEFTQQELQKIDKSNTEAVVREIDNIISILEKRKQEYQRELEIRNYEKQIQQLETELEEEKNLEKNLIKDKELAWETLLALERKLQEIEIGKDMVENIFVKIGYFSELPSQPEKGKRKIITLISTFIGVGVGIFVALGKEMYLKLRMQI
ncbi:MAG: hypothetical protein N2Z73_00290, partial [Endomicrobia bacterium]|nr:hypothetical protein [Endomicrobiia bacterium]